MKRYNTSSADTASTPDQGYMVALRDTEIYAADGRLLLHVPSLDVHPGERIVVKGPSGSGKSMLLNTLAGRLPTGVTRAGHRTSTATRIGYVPQRGLDALHPLVPLNRQLRAVTGATVTRIASVLDAVGLDDPALQRRRPAELSGGQAQRAAISLAILTAAPLILADEPTSALDHETRDTTLRLLTELLTPEQTLIVATHDTTLFEPVATRWLSLNQGTLTDTLVMPLRATA